MSQKAPDYHKKMGLNVESGDTDGTNQWDNSSFAGQIIKTPPTVTTPHLNLDEDGDFSKVS